MHNRSRIARGARARTFDGKGALDDDSSTKVTVRNEATSFFLGRGCLNMISGPCAAAQEHGCKVASLGCCPPSMSDSMRRVESSQQVLLIMMSHNNNTPISHTMPRRRFQSCNRNPAILIILKFEPSSGSIQSLLPSIMGGLRKAAGCAAAILNISFHF